MSIISALVQEFVTILADVSIADEKRPRVAPTQPLIFRVLCFVFACQTHVYWTVLSEYRIHAIEPSKNVSPV